MRKLLIAMLAMAIPAALALSTAAEAKRFRFPGGSSKTTGNAGKTIEKPGASQSSGRGGASILVVPGIGSAQAATRPEEADGKRQFETRNREAEEARKEAARKSESTHRASLPLGHEIPRLGMMAVSEDKPVLPGFVTLN